MGSLCLCSFELLDFGQSGPSARAHSRGNFLLGAPCATARLLPGFWTGEGVSGTVSVAVFTSIACARGGVMGGVTSSVTGW